MPIYEYQSLDPDKSCPKCSVPFEVIQNIGDNPLEVCPACGEKVRKIVSWCRGAVVETSDEYLQVERQISDYEKQGMWSHAAELADKHSEKTKDKSTKMRALDNYEKAGYPAETLEKHSKSDDN